MLVLSRKVNESIVINDDITVMVVDIRGDKVRLGVEAPKETPVHRREVYDAINHSREATDVTKPKEPEPEVNNAVLQNTLDLQARITHLERENQQLKDRNKQLEETANQEIQRRETELVTLTQQLDVHKAHHLSETKGLNDRYVSVLSSHSRLGEINTKLEETVQKLHTDYQITISNLHNEIECLQHDASNTERIIANLQDEIVDLTDCKEHLRQLGQEFCGCDHVESPDERAQQINHILETMRKLADNNLEYQQEIMGLQNQLRVLQDNQHPTAPEPTIMLCGKHSIIHTKNRGCYLCNIENDNLRAAFPRATKLS